MSNSPTDLHRRRRLRSAWLSLVLAGLPVAAATAAIVDPQVLARARGGNTVDVIIVFADQSRPSLAPLRPDSDYRVRRRALVDALRVRADRDQVGLRTWLDARGIGHRDFWIVNALQATVPASSLLELAVRGDTVRIEPNPQVTARLPQPQDASVSEPQAGDVATGIAWGVAKIEAPTVWDSGFDGQGVVIGGEDTGIQWDHPALQPQYRGWNGSAADHNFNWHDAVHDAASEPLCGNDSPFPCDPFGHGTHTAGSFAGDDGASAKPRHQIGVAPGARWIGCRNMDKSGTGTPARYIECMQWMLAPTDSNNENPDPDLAPDIVSNSWSCPTYEGCTTGDEIHTAVDALVTSGIFYAAAAQNYGSGCGSITDPPAIYDSSFVVGATDSADALAWFSSRGPVGGNTLIRPDVSAPGVTVCSSVPTSSYACSGWNGTSMATPHVAGTAALLLSAFPALKGHPDRIGAILRATAVTQGVANTSGVVQSCGGTPITQWPNYMVGYGRVDSWNAYHEVIYIDGFDG